jgi:hypothetical protein
MPCKRSRLRATVAAAVCLEVTRDHAIAAAKRPCSYRTGKARVPPPLKGENVLNRTSDRSIIARLRYLQTLDTGAIPTTISGG